MYNISASDLIKKSSKTICYFRNKNKQYPVSERMIEGNKAAERKIISEFKEMRGCYAYNDFLIFYSVDEIIPTGDKVLFMEHKNIEDGSVIEDWYLNACILQTALYHSLAELNPDRKYYTAKFFKKQGYASKFLNIVNCKIESYLEIGNDSYRVIPLAPYKIVEFFLNKAVSTIGYESAMDWDAEWKFKEFNYLRKYIKHEKS